MKQTMTYIGLILVFITLVFFIGFGNGYRSGKNSVHCPDIPTPDTTVIRDTITQYEPKEVAIWKDKPVPYKVEVTVRDTLHDTVTVYLPKETRLYKEDDYEAQVSGVFPSLDWIKVFPETKIITQPVIQKVKPHWAIGLQAGYGFSGKFSPYIGIGIQYNIFSW